MTKKRGPFIHVELEQDLKDKFDVAIKKKADQLSIKLDRSTVIREAIIKFIKKMK